jgi:hypothetical protein
MTRGADVEDRWVHLWNELYDALSANPQLIIVDEHWQSLSLEDAQELIQRAVYQGLQPRFERTWYQGKQALQILRTSLSKW